MTIMERICALIEERGIKNKTVCDVMGIGASTFSTWKAANMEGIPCQYIPPLAKLFDMTCDELLTGETQIIPDENDKGLLSVYRGLDWEGRQMVISAAVHEKRRMQQEQASIAE